MCLTERNLTTRLIWLKKILKREWDVTKYGVFTRPVLWLKQKAAARSV
jgi:hypothetical protein